MFALNRKPLKPLRLKWLTHYYQWRCEHSQQPPMLTTRTDSRIAVLSFLVLLTAGCGGEDSASIPSTSTPSACTPASTPEFAYMLSGDAVSMYTVNSCSGSFTPIAAGSVATGSSESEPEPTPESMIVDPEGRFAYVANLVSNSADEAMISMYTIDARTGVLTPTSPATVRTGFYPQGMAISPSGNFVYTANSDDNTISMFTVDSTTGVLTPTSPAAVTAGWSPLSVTVDPSGRFAYAANQDDNTVSMYNINPNTGILTPTTPATVPTEVSPFGVTIDPSGKFAYVPNTYSNGNTVSQYTIDSVTGVLTPNSPATVTAGKQPTAVGVDPFGRFAYVVNRADDTVSMFTIDPQTGTLAANGVIAAGSQSFRIVFDPSGKFVYVVNETSAASVYTINSDGTLAAVGVTGSANGALSMAVTAPTRDYPAPSSLTP